MWMVLFLACTGSDKDAVDTDIDPATTEPTRDTATTSVDTDTDEPSGYLSGGVGLTNNTATPIGLVAWETEDAYGENPFFPPAAPGGGYFGSLTYPVGVIELSAIGDDGRCAAETFTIVADEIIPWTVADLPGVWKATPYGGNCTIER